MTYIIYWSVGGLRHMPVLLMIKYLMGTSFLISLLSIFTNLWMTLYVIGVNK